MGNDLARLAYLVVLLCAVGGFLVVEFRARPGATLRQVMAWGLIFVGAIAGAGLWQDMRQQVAPRPIPGPEGRLTIPLDGAGHARLVAEVNGVPIRFVVDTGASTLTLRQRDARRVGIDPAGLAYVGRAGTANGTVATADVTLDSLTLAGVTDRAVPAVVVQGDLDRSLMGMSYLRRFARVSIEGDTMVLQR